MGLNSFFDFTRRQLWFIGIMSSVAVLMGSYLLIRAHAFPAEDVPQIHIAEEQPQVYSGSFIVDINSAPQDSLELIEGIGPVLARRIVEYREHSRFLAVDELEHVKGIGPVLLAKMKPFVKAGDSL